MRRETRHRFQMTDIIEGAKVLAYLASSKSSGRKGGAGSRPSRCPNKYPSDVVDPQGAPQLKSLKAIPLGHLSPHDAKAGQMSDM